MLTRRSFVGWISAAIATTSGCQALQSNSKPGMFIVENKDTIPHLLEFRIISYKSNSEEEMNEEKGRIAIEPGKTKQYSDFFDLSREYMIIYRLPDSKPSSIPYGRKGISTKNNLVFINILDGGNVNGGIRTV